MSSVLSQNIFLFMAVVTIRNGTELENSSDKKLNVLFFLLIHKYDCSSFNSKSLSERDGFFSELRFRKFWNPARIWRKIFFPFFYLACSKKARPTKFFVTQSCRTTWCPQWTLNSMWPVTALQFSLCNEWHSLYLPNSWAMNKLSFRKIDFFQAFSLLGNVQIHATVCSSCFLFFPAQVALNKHFLH